MTDRDGGAGPWVGAACFCEKVIEAKDGLITLVSVLDRVIVRAAAVGGQPPEEMPHVDSAMPLVLRLYPGGAQGRARVDVQLEGVDGLVRPLSTQAVLFEGPDRPINIIVNANLRLTREGIIWFIVQVDGRTLTRVPLRIIYEPQSLGLPRLGP